MKQNCNLKVQVVFLGSMRDHFSFVLERIRVRRDEIRADSDFLNH